MCWRCWAGRSRWRGWPIRPPPEGPAGRPSCSAHGNKIPISAVLLDYPAGPTISLARPARPPQRFNRGNFTMDAKTETTAKTATLTVGNKNYDFPILSGTVGPDVIDISKLYAQSGMFTYDPGFASTGSCQSRITYIDGDAG